MSTFKRISGDYTIQSVNTGDRVIINSGNVYIEGNLWVSGNTQTYTSNNASITNKFVYDFTSDGQMDSTNGTTTYYTSGFNPNRFRYVLNSSAGPNATFVKVQSA